MRGFLLPPYPFNLVSIRTKFKPGTSVAILLFLLTVTVFWPGLHGNFFFDDEPNILLREGIKLTLLSWDSLYQALFSRSHGLLARPLSQLSFALNHYFSGFDPFAFKLTNLVIHLVNGLLIYRLAARLLQNSLHDVKPAALILVLFWLLHPIQLTPVLFVVQRMTSLAALFTLCALLLHIRARETQRARLFLPAWLFCWPLALISKETAILFPAYVWMWELTLFRSQQGKLDRFAHWYSMFMLLTIVAGVSYLLLPAGSWFWAGYDFRPFTLGERLLTEGRVLWLYLEMMLTPTLPVFALHHDDIPISTGWLSPWTTLPAWSGLAGLLFFAWKLRDRVPLVSFSLLWFFVGHALESGFIPLELVYEHRNYLPLFGILMALSVPMAALVQKKGVLKTATLTLMVGALLYCTLLTVLRSDMYGSESRRTQIEAQYHPNSPRINYELGLTLLENSRPGDIMAYVLAENSFKRATSLDPNDKAGLLGQVFLQCLTNGNVAQPVVNQLAQRLHTTLFPPGDSTLMYGLKDMAIVGTLCLTRKEIDMLFNAALTNPRVLGRVKLQLYSWHADYLWLGAQDVGAARRALSLSLALDHLDTSNRLKWVQLLLLSGQLTEARQALTTLDERAYHGEEKITLTKLRADLDNVLSQSRAYGTLNQP